MIVALCPACREQVTVPMDASPSSLVRCPLCNAEFRLGEFLAQLPPPLIVVPDQSPQRAVESDLPDATSDSDSLRRDESEAADDASQPAVTEPLPAFDFTPGTAPASPPRPREPVRRPPRKQKNMAWEMAKIVGGALLAVPAAQAILWWFVPRDWQRDLLGIGPTVSRAVPWVVPQQFRDIQTEIRWEEGSEIDARVDRRGASPLTPPKVTPRVAAQPKDVAPTKDPPDRQTREPVAAGTARPGETTSATAPPAGDMAAPTAADGGPAGAPEATPPSDTHVSHAPDAAGTRFQTEDLRVALEQALQASVDWDTSPDQSEANRATMTDAFYQSFARVGEILAFLARNDSQSEELLKDLRVLLESFARQPNKLAMIGNRGQAWLEQPTRPNAGVILFGTVRSTRPYGDVFATELDLAARQKRAVTVISPGDPLRFYGVGDRVLLLGTLVPPPANVVAAAPGGQQPETFVWGSLPVPLGK